MTSFARTQRRRRDRPRARITFLRGALVTLVLMLLGWQALKLYNGVPTTNYKEVYVSTPIIGNLLSHDAVRVAGKRVGQVLDTDIGSDGQPRIKLQLNPGTKLPADSKVLIRANGLLGARYVELKPGKSSALLEAGDVLRGTEASYTYGLPEAIDVFNSETRGGMQSSFRNLGAGMLHNGQGLNELLKIARVQTPNFKDVMDSVLAREGAAGRLFPSLASGMTAFARNTSYVKPWTNAVSAALAPINAERENTRKAIEELPAMLHGVTYGTGLGRDLLASVNDLASAAQETLPPLPSGMRALSALLRTGQGPIQRLHPKFINQVRAGLNAPFDGAPALQELAPRADQLFKNIKPLLTEVADHSCDIRNGVASLRSVTGFEQNSAAGEQGAAMAFRMQVVPGGLDQVGLGDTTVVKRAGYPKDCTYDSKPYPQFVPAGGRR